MTVQKISKIIIVFTLVSCSTERSRDRMEFANSLNEIEESTDSVVVLLSKIPKPDSNKSIIKSYYIKDLNIVLNGEIVNDKNEDFIFLQKKEQEEFIFKIRFLERNRITACSEQCVPWSDKVVYHYEYKALPNAEWSDMRDIVNITTVDSVRMKEYEEILDRKGNLFLIKHKNIGVGNIKKYTCQ